MDQSKVPTGGCVQEGAQIYYRTIYIIIIKQLLHTVYSGVSSAGIAYVYSVPSSPILTYFLLVVPIWSVLSPSLVIYQYNMKVPIISVISPGLFSYHINTTPNCYIIPRSNYSPVQVNLSQDLDDNIYLKPYYKLNLEIIIYK